MTGPHQCDRHQITKETVPSSVVDRSPKIQPPVCESVDPFASIFHVMFDYDFVSCRNVDNLFDMMDDVSAAAFQPASLRLNRNQWPLAVPC